mmetsp:Transcript_57404/g.133824  ORF Transcript_57404/g.133824 Transcript_57404/m.133824 type:complete len:216 (-) Transcript_57404:450-1097(-)
MTPRWQGLLGPIGNFDFREGTCAKQVLLVRVEGDKVGMAPLGVQKVESVALFVCERRRRITLAPCGNDQLPPWCENSHHLLYIFLLIWHVLSRLTAPDQVEAFLREAHVQGVHDFEVCIADACLLCQGGGPTCLFWRQGDASDFSVGEPLRKDPRRTANATTYVKDFLRRRRTAEVDHFRSEVNLGCLEVLEWTEAGPEKGHQEGVILPVALLCR